MIVGGVYLCFLVVLFFLCFFGANGLLQDSKFSTPFMFYPSYICFNGHVFDSLNLALPMSKERFAEGCIDPCLVNAFDQTISTGANLQLDLFEVRSVQRSRPYFCFEKVPFEM